LSRFVVLEIPEYTFEEFKEIAVTKLAKEKIDKYTATFIAKKVWHELGSRDIRDVIKVARLASNVQEIPFVIKMLGRQNNLVRKKRNQIFIDKVKAGIG
jgi:holliday junction DNA helicase RuvB